MDSTYAYYPSYRSQYARGIMVSSSQIFLLLMTGEDQGNENVTEMGISKTAKKNYVITVRLMMLHCIGVHSMCVEIDIERPLIHTMHFNITISPMDLFI